MSASDPVQQYFASVEYAGVSACLNKANEQSAHYRRAWLDLEKNWKPNGYYTPDQIDKLVKAAFDAAKEALRNGEKAMAKPMASGARDAIRSEYNTLQRMLPDTIDYFKATTDARKKGLRVIDAPGLKRWIVSVAKRCEDLITAIAYVQCMQPWWLAALAAFQRIFDFFVSLAKSIVGMAVALGELIGKLPDTLGAIGAVVKWGAIATVGGAIAYAIYKKGKGGKS